MRLAPLFAAAALFALPACSKPAATPADGSAGMAQTDKSDKSLAEMLASDSQFKALAAGLKSTGLDGVFSGKGDYTLLAPNDAAFAALGGKAAALAAPEQQAALAAVLRAHVIPGMLTTGDIGKAIDANEGKPISMRTMGTGTVSFARTDAGFTVTSDDGASAKLAGAGLIASNGGVLPIDAVLKKF